MAKQFTVKWLDRGHPPRVAPDPAFPNGKHIDSGERPACQVRLPYMTKINVGYWLIECNKCGSNMLITAASRRDDARTVMLPCAPRGTIN